MAPELIEQNAELRSLYTPSGFPTIVLADAEGMPWARLVGYKPQDAWLEAMNALLPRKQHRDEALQRAAGLEGRDRAAGLRVALDRLDAADARAYSDLIAEIHRIEFPQAEAADPAIALQHYLRTRSDANNRGAAPEEGEIEQPPLRLRPAAPPRRPSPTPPSSTTWTSS
jgi:hypothetical protein